MGEDNIVIADELVNTARLMDCEILASLIEKTHDLRVFKVCVEKSNSDNIINLSSFGRDIIPCLDNWLSFNPADEVVVAINTIKQTINYSINGVATTVDMVNRIREALMVLFPYIDNYFLSILTTKPLLNLTCRVEEVDRAITAISDYRYADVALINSLLMKNINNLALCMYTYSKMTESLIPIIGRVQTMYDIHTINNTISSDVLYTEFQEGTRHSTDRVYKLASSLFSHITSNDLPKVTPITPDTPRETIVVELEKIMKGINDLYTNFIDMIMTGLNTIYHLDFSKDMSSDAYERASVYKKQILLTKLTLDWCINIIIKSTDSINDSVIKLSKSVSADSIDDVDLL